MNSITNIYLFSREFVKKISKDHISAFSAQTSYFITVCFFPLLIFVLTMIQYTPITEEILYTILIEFTPKKLNPLIFSFINDVYSHSTITLSSISAISALWTSSKAFFCIYQGLNKVNNIDTKANYIFKRLYAVIYTLLFVIVILIILSFLLFGNRLYEISSSFLLSLLIKYKFFIMSVTLTIIFTFMYKFLPERKTTFTKELPGAALAAIGWQLFSYLYSIYIDNSSSFAAMYGNLGAIVFTLLWLYFCINIFFYGAELNYLLWINKS